MKTNISCFIMTSINIFGSILIAENSVYVNSYVLYFMYIVAFIFNLFVAFKYAPADTEAVPILSKRIIRRNKIIAIMTVVIFYIVSLLVVKDLAIRNIMLVMLTFVAFMATPVFYKLVGEKHSYESEEFQNI